MIAPADWTLQKAFIEDAIKTAWPQITRLYFKAPEQTGIVLPYAVAKPMFANVEGGSTFSEDGVAVNWEIVLVWQAPDSDEVSEGVAYLYALAMELLQASVPGAGMLPTIVSADPVAMDADNEKRRLTTASFTYRYDLERP